MAVTDFEVQALAQIIIRAMLFGSGYLLLTAFVAFVLGYAVGRRS